MKIDKREWAESKVDDYYPSGPEKVTLMAIARKVRYITGKAIVSRYRLAQSAGKSMRTVQRHIQKLDKLGYLLVDREAKYEHRSSIYRIPMTSFTSEELFFMSAFSPGKWMVCLIDPCEGENSIWSGGQLRTVSERQWETKRLLLGDKATGSGSQADSPPNDLKQRFKTTAGPIAEPVIALLTEAIDRGGEQGIVSIRKSVRQTEGRIIPREVFDPAKIALELDELEALGADVSLLRERYQGGATP